MLVTIRRIFFVHHSRGLHLRRRVDKFPQAMRRNHISRKLDFAKYLEFKKRMQTGIIEPKKLQSVGVKRAMEAALWKQGIRKSLKEGQKRHEFQTDHGLRKWFKTRCELAHMRSINIELLWATLSAFQIHTIG